MEVNQETKHLEIILHVFIDDLQAAIEQSVDADLRLGTASESPLADSLIHNYVASHLKLMNGDAAKKLSWVGKEQSDDLTAFWCFLESEPISEPEGLRVQFSLLQDLYDDQQNILNVIWSNGDESYHLCRPGDNFATID